MINPSKDVVLRKDVSFGRPENKILLLDPIVHQTGNFRAISEETKFRLKAGFNTTSKHR